MALKQDYDFLFKLLLVGNSSVGKSSILVRFCDNIFNENFLPTIGVDFKIRTLELNNKIVKLQIWDTAGQERFKTITSSYYKGAQGVIIVYDITDKQSFRDIENWLMEVERHASESVVKILVGNKLDLEGQRNVSKEEAMQFAEQNGMKFIETSAKDSQNVEKAFFTIANEIKSKFVHVDEEPQQKQAKYNTKLNKAQKIDEEKKQGCC